MFARSPLSATHPHLSEAVAVLQNKLTREQAIAQAQQATQLRQTPAHLVSAGDPAFLARRLRRLAGDT